MRMIWLMIACVLTACAGPKAIPEPQPIILNWSQASIPDSSAEAWAREAEKWLHTRDFVLVVCHGSSATVKGADGKSHAEWNCYPDPPRKAMRVDDVAWVLRMEHWGKPLVFISCNAGGFELTAPRTLYGKRIIWSCPDAASPLYQFRDRAVIGRIEDFTWTEIRLAGQR